MQPLLLATDNLNFVVSTSLVKTVKESMIVAQPARQAAGAMADREVTIGGQTKPRNPCQLGTIEDGANQCVGESCCHEQ